MAITQSGKITLNVLSTLKNVLDLSQAADALSKKFSVSLANGTAAGQANQTWHDQRTLGASASENLDLAGALVDAFGQTITFATIKAIFVMASGANVNNVNVTSDGTSGVPGLFLALGDGIVVKPGGCFAWVAPGTGAAVTATTGDLLTVANSGAGTGVTYDVIIIGTV